MSTIRASTISHIDLLERTCWSQELFLLWQRVSFPFPISSSPIFLVLNSISSGVMEILGWRKRLSYSVKYITSGYTKFFLRSLMVYEFAHRYMHIAYVD